MKSHLTIRSGSHQATQDDGKVLLGDAGKPFDSVIGAGKPNSEAKTVARHAATEDAGKVRLGDAAIVF